MSRRLWFISVSVAAHLAIALLVFASQVWHIDRLDRDHRPLSTLAVFMPPAGAAGGGALELPKPELTPKPRPKRVVAEVVQPVATLPPEQPDAPARESVEGGGGGGDGDGPGDGPGGPGGPGDHGTCTTPPCGDGGGDDTAPPPREEPVREILVPPVELVRTSGETQIQPDALTHGQMRREGKTRAIAVFKICITEVGAVASTKLLRSTGYPAYDHRLLSAVRGWRYRPPTRGGHARVCSTVTFQYVLR